MGATKKMKEIFPKNGESNQLLEIISEEEYQSWLSEKEAEYHRKYGYGAAFKMAWNEFIKDK